MLHQVPAVVPLSRTVEVVRGIRGMLFVPPTVGAQRQTNLTAAARTGTTVTAHGTPHSEGSWTSIIDPTSKPSFGIWVRGRGVGASNTNTRMLLDIGYGPTGGGNEEVLLPDLNMAMAGNGGNGYQGKLYYFPVYIPSGTRVSARAQALIASDTIIVAVWLEQDPLYARAAGGVLAYGVVGASSRGTSVTPANGSFGSWTQLVASTTRAHRFWHVGYGGLDDTTVASADVLVELGTGPDSSNVTTILSTHFQQGSGEEVDGPFPSSPQFSPVPAAKAIFGRIASAETEARDLIAYGVD